MPVRILDGKDIRFVGIHERDPFRSIGIMFELFCDVLRIEAERQEDEEEENAAPARRGMRMRR